MRRDFSSPRAIRPSTRVISGIPVGIRFGRRSDGPDRFRGGSDNRGGGVLLHGENSFMGGRLWRGGRE